MNPELGHQLTHEQQTAINMALQGDSLKITAYAGAGKTSTLVELARSMAGKRGLYLAFNRAAKEDAAKKFEGLNVDVRTVNGYAMGWARLQYGEHLIPKPYKGFEFAEKFNVRLVKLDEFGFQNKNKNIMNGSAVASLVLSIVRTFCASSDIKISAKHIKPSAIPAIPKRLRHNDILSYERRGDFDDIEISFENARLYPDSINAQKSKLALRIGVLEIAVRLWDEILADKTTHKYEHDYFLKLLHLSGSDFHHDYIMLDEAQDSSAVVVDIMNRSTKQKIIVGDSYQQIYAFRGAIDAMVKVWCDANATLSTSFRFGQSLADLATTFINDNKHNQPVNIQGYAHTEISLGGINDRDINAVICRTNANAIQIALGFLSQGLKIRLRFREENSKVLLRIRAINEIVTMGKTNEFKHPDYDYFENITQFFDHCETEEGTEDRGYLKIIQAVGVQLIEQLFGKSRATRKSIEIMTAHKSKGLEWDNVRLANDFPENGFEGEEGNLLYVAMTRAKKTLDISQCLPLIETFNSLNPNATNENLKTRFIFEYALSVHNCTEADLIAFYGDDIDKLATLDDKTIRAYIDDYARNHAPMPKTSLDDGMVRCTECMQDKCPHRRITERNVQTNPRLIRCIHYTPRNLVQGASPPAHEHEAFFAALSALQLLVEDKTFIDKRTQELGLDAAERQSVLAEYARIWRESAAAMPTEHRKNNAGRFSANSWLRDLSFGAMSKLFNTPTAMNARTPPAEQLAGLK